MKSGVIFIRETCWSLVLANVLANVLAASVCRGVRRSSTDSRVKWFRHATSMIFPRNFILSFDAKFYCRVREEHFRSGVRRVICLVRPWGRSGGNISAPLQTVPGDKRYNQRKKHFDNMIFIIVIIIMRIIWLLLLLLLSLLSLILFSPFLVNKSKKKKKKSKRKSKHNFCFAVFVAFLSLFY